MPEAVEYDFLDWLGPRIHERLVVAFPGVNACIMATRIAIEVASRTGYALRPLPVRLIAFNGKMTERMMRSRRMPRDREELHLWCERGAWGVRIGYGDDATGWDGHLIAAGADHFLDASIKQVERPEHNLLVGAHLVGPVTRLKNGNREVITDNGVTLFYDAMRWNTLFRRAPDWTERTRRNGIVEELTEAWLERVNQ
jgi:hypothetical protein